MKQKNKGTNPENVIKQICNGLGYETPDVEDFFRGIEERYRKQSL